MSTSSAPPAPPPPSALVDRVLAARVSHTLAAFGGTAATEDAQPVSSRGDPLSARVRTKQKQRHTARDRHRQPAAPLAHALSSSTAASAVPVPPASHAHAPTSVSIPLVRASWLPGLDPDSSSASSSSSGTGSFLSLLLHPGTHPALASISRVSSDRAMEVSQSSLASAVYAPLMRDHLSASPWLSVSRSVDSLSARELRAFRAHIFLTPEVQLLLRLLWELAVPKRKSDELLSFSGYKSMYLRIHKRFLGGNYRPREVAKQCEKDWVRDWSGSGSGQTKAVTGAGPSPAGTAATPAPSREFSVVQGLPIQYFLQSLFDLVDQFITERGTVDVDTTQVYPASVSISGSEGATHGAIASEGAETQGALGSEVAGVDKRTDAATVATMQAPEIHRGPAVASVPLGLNRVSIPLPATARYVRVLEKVLREITYREPVTEPAEEAEAPGEQLPQLYRFALRDLPNVSMADFNVASAEDCTPLELRSYTLSAVYALLQHPSSEFQRALHMPRVAPATAIEPGAASPTAVVASAASGAVHQPLPSAAASGDLRTPQAAAVTPVQVHHAQTSATLARGATSQRTQAPPGATATVGADQPHETSASAAPPAVATTASQPPATIATGAVSSATASASAIALRSSAPSATAATSAAASPSTQSKSPRLGPAAAVVVDAGPKTKLQSRSSAPPLKLLVHNASAPVDPDDDRDGLPSDSPVGAWGGRDEELDAEALAAVKRNSSSSASLLEAGSAPSVNPSPPVSATVPSTATSSKPKRPSVAAQHRTAAGSSKPKENAPRVGSTDHTSALSSPSLTTKQIKQSPQPSPSASAPKSPARARPQLPAASSVTSSTKSPSSTAAVPSPNTPVASSSPAAAIAGTIVPAAVSAADSKSSAGSSSPPKSSMQASTAAQSVATVLTESTTADGAAPAAAAVPSSTNMPPRPMHVRHASLTASLAPKPRLRTLVSMALAASRAENAASVGGAVPAAVASGGGSAASVSGSAGASSSSTAAASKPKLSSVPSRDLSTPPPPKQVDHTNSLLSSLRALVNLGAKSISAHLDALKRREETAALAANALVATAIPSAAVNIASAATAVPSAAASRSGSKVVSAAPSPAGSKRGSVVGTPAGGPSPMLKPAMASSSSSTASLELAGASVASAITDASTAASADGLHVMEGTSNNEELTDLAADGGSPVDVAEPDAEQIIAQARSSAAQASLDATHLALRDASESSAITADVDALLGLVSSAHEARRGGEKTSIEVMIDQATALHRASNMEIERLPQFIVDAAAQVDETMAARKARVALQAAQMKAEAAAAASSSSGSSSPRKTGGGRPRAASVIDAKSSSARGGGGGGGGAGSLAHSNSSRTNLAKLKAAAAGSGATTASASGETTPTTNAGSGSPKRVPLGGSKKGAKGSKKSGAGASAAPSASLPPVSPAAAAAEPAAAVPADQADGSSEAPVAAAISDASTVGAVGNDAADDADSRSSTPKTDTLIAAFHVAVDGGVKFKAPEVIERQRIEDQRPNVAADAEQQEQERAALAAEMRGDRQEEADAEISPVDEGDENEAALASGASSRLASPSHATAATAGGSGFSPPLSPSGASAATSAARQSLLDASLSRNTWHHNQVLLGRSTRDEAREEARMEAALAAQALRIKTQQQRLSERRGREHGAQKRAARVSLSQQDGEILRQQLAEEKAAKAEELAAEIALKRAAVKAPRILVSAGAIGALTATHAAALSDPFMQSQASDLVPAVLSRKSPTAASSKLAVHSAGGAHKRYTSAFENLLSVVDDDAAATAALAAAHALTDSKIRAAATMFPAASVSRPSRTVNSDDLFAHLETIAEPIVTSGGGAPSTPPLSPRSQALEDAQNQRRVELTAEEEAAMMRGENEEEGQEEKTEQQPQQQQSQTQELLPSAAILASAQSGLPRTDFGHQSEARREHHSTGLSAAKIAPQARTTKKQLQPQPSPPRKSSPPAHVTTKDADLTAPAGSSQSSAGTTGLRTQDGPRAESSIAVSAAVGNHSLDRNESSTAPTAAATAATVPVPVLHKAASDKSAPTAVATAESEFQHILTQHSSAQQSVPAVPSARKSNPGMHSHYQFAQEVLAEEEAIRQPMQSRDKQHTESKQEADSQLQPHPTTARSKPSSTLARQYGVGRDAARSKKTKSANPAVSLTSKLKPAAASTGPDTADQDEEEESKQPFTPSEQQPQEAGDSDGPAAPHRQPAAAAAVPELSSWSALESALSSPNVSPAEVLSLQRLLSSLRASTHASRGSILDPAATHGGKRIHPHLYSSPFALPSRRLIENRTALTLPGRCRSTSPRKHDVSASASQTALGDRVLSEKQLAREQAWALEEQEWEQSMIASGRAQELFEMQQARHIEQQRRTRAATKLPPATKTAATASALGSSSSAVQAPASPPKPQVRRSMLPMLAPGQLPLRGLKLHPFVSKDVAASVASLQHGEEPLANEIKGKGVPRAHQQLMARSQTIFSTHAPTLALVPLLQLAPLVNSASNQSLSARPPASPSAAPHDGGGGSQSSRSSRSRRQVQLASSLSKPALSARDWSVLDRIQLRAYSPPARSGIPSRAGAVALASSFREMEAQPPPSRLQSEIYSFLATPGGPTDAEPGVAPLERMPTSLPRVESEQIARRDAEWMAQLSTHMTRALAAPPRLSLSARDAFDPSIAAAHLSSSLDLASSARHETMGSSLRFEPSPGGNIATPATEPAYMHLVMQERVAREALARGEIGEASLAAAALAAAKAQEAKAAAAAEAEAAAAREAESQAADTRPATGQSRPLSATDVAVAPFEGHPQQPSHPQHRSDPPTPVRSRTPVRSPVAIAAASSSAEPTKLNLDAAVRSTTNVATATAAASVPPTTLVRPPSRPSSQRARIVTAAPPSSSTAGSPRSSSPSGSPKSPPRAPGSAGKSSRARAAAALAAGGGGAAEGRRRGSSSSSRGHARRGSAGSEAPAATVAGGLKSSAAPTRSAVSTGLRPRSAAAVASVGAGSGSTPRSPRSPALGPRSPLVAPRSPSSSVSQPPGAGAHTADVALSAAVESILAASFASPYAGHGTPEASAGPPSHSRRMSALKGSRPSSRERLSVSFNLRTE